MRTIIALTLSVLMAPPAFAQQNDAEAWRTFAQQLPANAFVRIKLTDGTNLRAYVVQATDEGLRVNPKTRVAVPLRQLSYGDIVSIERQKVPKWNPASKVLLGVGIAVGVLYMIAFAALAGLD